LLSLFAGAAWAQGGNHVFSGAEQTTFVQTDLATPGGQTWTTDRGASPGYFSAVGPNGSYTGAADGTFALVDGYVKFYATAAGQGFSFPVGVDGATAAASDLRTLSVSGAVPANAELATAWIVGDPSGSLDPTSTGAAAGAHSTASMGTGILGVSTAGQWDWQDIGANANGVTITVSIPNMSTFATTANLRLVGWNGTQWIDLSATQGNTAASGNAENSTLTGTMQSNITAIGIGSVAVPLPVTLVRFTAKLTGEDVLAQWTTVQEVNSDYFAVEYSTDGTTYRQAGTQPAAGNSSSTRDYAFTHKGAARLNTAMLYYRLRQVDRDGQATYSQVVLIHLSSSVKGLIVFPNPAEPGSSFTVQADKLQEVVLYDMAGRVLYQRTGLDQQLLQVPTTGLASGSYMLRVNNSQSVKVNIK